MNKEILPVLDEISAVLKKHDMGGLVMVANQSHVDFRMEISPSWSCARTVMDEEGNLAAIRIRAKREEYPSAEAQKECLEKTIGTFVTFDHTMTVLQEQIKAVLAMVAKQVDFLGKSTREF